MNSERIEEILSKNGIEQSKELSLALEKILKAYSKDRQHVDNVRQEIQRQDHQDLRRQGIR
ncbi:MAG: acylaminoacyl-peptidase [Enterococcus canintestini]|uniref:acylaminoacyl-peptidase n=1 Tax=Enterococcus canintestini TaxID=317010 RepID=UPI003991B04D